MNRTPVFIYLRKLLVYMCFSFEYSASVCLFILIDVNRTRCKRPPVFIYLRKWHVDMCFSLWIFSIYLFTYVKATTCICLLTQILIDVNRTRCKRPPVFVYLCKTTLLACAFQYLFVYLCESDHLSLFTYANFNWCQQIQVQAPTCICLFMQMTLCWHVLSLWILISLCLLIIIDVNRSKCKRPPVFVYLCKTVLLTCAFTLNINISLFTYDNRCQQKQVDASGWRQKERGIGLIFSQKQEVKSVASRYSVSSDYNLIAVKDLIYLCILRIICNCRFFSQWQQELGSFRTNTSSQINFCSNQLLTGFTVPIFAITVKCTSL